jgi:hypothetical protein
MADQKLYTAESFLASLNKEGTSWDQSKLEETNFKEAKKDKKKK